MSFSRLPVEILELIFNNLDGISLARAQCVCKKWKSIIEAANLVSQIWKKRVTKEIPENMLQSIIGGMDLSGNVPESDVDEDEDKISFSTLKSSDLHLDWAVIYKSWWTSSKVGTWNHEMYTVSTAGTYPVTCCKVTGSWVLTGHTNGSICTWHLKSATLCHVPIQHLKMVTDFVLFDLFKNEWYGDPERPHKHHHIVSISKDHTIQVSPIFGPHSQEPNQSHKVILRHHSNSLDRIRSFGNSFAVSCVDQTISIWRLSFPPCPWGRAGIERTYVLHPHGPDVWSHMGFWKDQIICFCNNLKVIKFPKKTSYCLGRFEEPLLNNVNLILDDDDQEDVANVTVRTNNALMFWENTVLLFCVNRQLWVSVDGEHYRPYQCIERLGSCVLSACLRGRILAFGLEHGKLVVFTLTEPEDLVHLDLSEPAFQVQLSEASILSVDISEDEGSYPVIAATTTETIFYINWKPNKY